MSFNRPLRITLSKRIGRDFATCHYRYPTATRATRATRATHCPSTNHPLSRTNQILSIARSDCNRQPGKSPKNNFRKQKRMSIRRSGRASLGRRLPKRPGTKNRRENALPALPRHRLSGGRARKRYEQRTGKLSIPSGCPQDKQLTEVAFAGCRPTLERVRAAYRSPGRPSGQSTVVQLGDCLDSSPAWPATDELHAVSVGARVAAGSVAPS